MVRPRKTKVINFEPNITYFKPRGVLMVNLEEVDLTLDELESLRLANIEKFNQVDSAKKMNIHQSTFQRTLARAREKVTDALVNGKAIKIHGGNYNLVMKDNSAFHYSNADILRTSSNSCVCSSCGYSKLHTRGTPCSQIKCVNCGTFMIRK